MNNFMAARPYIIGLLFIASVTSFVSHAHAQQMESVREVSSSEVLEMTLQHNPVLRAAVLSTSRAVESIKGAEGLYPYVFQADAGYTRSSSPMGSSMYRTGDNISLGTSISRTFSSGTYASFSLEGQWYELDEPMIGSIDVESRIPNFALSASFVLNQPLLRGFGHRVGLAHLRQAKKEKTAADKAAEFQASYSAMSVLTAYWNLWLAAKQLEINLGSRTIAESQLREIEERVEAGAAAPVERLNYQTRLASLNEAVIESEAEIRRLQVVLTEKTGLIDSQEILSAKIDEPLPESEHFMMMKEIVDVAMNNAPSINEAISQLDLAEERVLIAGESARQKLDLVGRFGASTLARDEFSPVITDYSKKGAYGGYIGLNYELPLDNRKKESEIAQARINVDIAGKQLVHAKNQVRSEAAVAHNRLITAKRRLDSAKETLLLAQAQAEAEQERYRLGVSIFTAVRDAEEAVRQAELRLTKARVDMVQAQIEIDHLTGKLLSLIADKLNRD